MKYSIYPITLSLVLLSNTASAILIDRSTIISDTETQLDWLDLSRTVNTEISDVLSQMAPGGQFEGWTLASREQVITFLGNAGGNVFMMALTILTIAPAITMTAAGVPRTTA